MATLLNEIEWSEPIMPLVPNVEWEAEVKRERGTVGDVFLRVSPSPWLRRACLMFERYKVSRITFRQVGLSSLVTAQENSCRYCYGASRTFMRLLGYPERMISRIEREVQMAELDPKERAFIQFTRNLARSNPRPARAEREALIALGYSPLEVAEMAFMVTAWCFFNRVTTLVASPPALDFEAFPNSLRGRLMSFAGPWLLRPIMARKMRAKPAEWAKPEGTTFRSIVDTLEGLPAAPLLSGVLESAMASPVLPRRTKLLMFAVVARALGCKFCQSEVKEVLVREGFGADEVEACLAALASPALERFEVQILNWVRDTVHYKPIELQQRTRELGEQIGEAALLEAIGIAALANCTVRLAMLLE